MNPSRILGEWPHRWYGFWKSWIFRPDDELPPIAAAIDPSWNPDDKASLVTYLLKSPVLYGAKVQLTCLLCAAELHRCYQSDNVWVWHHSLAHYVAEHHVVLPGTFVEHIRARNCTPPSRSEVRHWQLPWPDSWPGARIEPDYTARPPSS